MPAARKTSSISLDLPTRKELVTAWAFCSLKLERSEEEGRPTTSTETYVAGSGKVEENDEIVKIIRLEVRTTWECIISESVKVNGLPIAAFLWIYARLWTSRRMEDMQTHSKSASLHLLVKIYSSFISTVIQPKAVPNTPAEQ